MRWPFVDREYGKTGGSNSALRQSLANQEEQAAADPAPMIVRQDIQRRDPVALGMDESNNQAGLIPVAGSSSFPSGRVWAMDSTSSICYAPSGMPIRERQSPGSSRRAILPIALSWRGSRHRLSTI